MFLQVRETVADVDVHFGVSETGGHGGEVLFGDLDHHFVDFDEGYGFDCGVLDYFAEDAAVAAADN